MIPESFIESWRINAQWQTILQVEQDLVLSRALIDLYNDPHIKDVLVFRGGTALNKLFLQPSARYSEDIDFVQKNPEPIGQTIDSIRNILQPWLGEPKRKITERSAKLVYKYEAINKLPAKLKIEINTTEHFQVLPLKIEPFTVNSEWFQGKADIITYEIDELIATKLRALYQRRKGRDLFDLWYVSSQNLINIDRVIDIFQQYCTNDGLKVSGEQFKQNLELKKKNKDFQLDMKILLPSKINWDFEEAFDFVTQKIISRLP
ncbi:MAG: nucleotidyl transferase AbiEii/AbiGii toxin family protein [Gammaproteobacteria bacterium]|jgi:predicted nucleotidyltransferase component of viral defense system|nr:nucleotidyl transferase AbiEii/AbiGii toxin family protein [Gammaproteobacteria bacterium]